MSVYGKRCSYWHRNELRRQMGQRFVRVWMLHPTTLTEKFVHQVEHQAAFYRVCCLQGVYASHVNAQFTEHSVQLQSLPCQRVLSYRFQIYGAVAYSLSRYFWIYRRNEGINTHSTTFLNSSSSSRHSRGTKRKSCSQFRDGRGSGRRSHAFFVCNSPRMSRLIEIFLLIFFFPSFLRSVLFYHTLLSNFILAFILYYYHYFYYYHYSVQYRYSHYNSQSNGILITFN